MNEARKTVAVAVITANRCAMLDACLQSLLRSDYPADELIVLDNASTDDTPSMLASKYPQVRHVRMETNKGLTFCHNTAMRLFRSDCLFLLDDDNEVAPDMLGKLVNYLHAPGNERLAIVVPVIYDYYDPPTVVVPGGSTCLWSGRNNLNPKTIDPSRVFYETQRVPNSTLIKREIIENYGPMDEQLFSTLADEDYVRGMNRDGWHAHVLLSAATYHKQKMENDPARRYGMTNPARAYILARNRTVIIRRYANPVQLLVYLLVFNTVFAAFYLYVLLAKVRKPALTRAYLRGQLDGLRYVFTKKLPPLEYVLSMAKSA